MIRVLKRLGLTLIDPPPAAAAAARAAAARLRNLAEVPAAAVDVSDAAAAASVDEEEDLLPASSRPPSSFTSSVRDISTRCLYSPLATLTNGGEVKSQSLPTGRPLRLSSGSWSETPR